MRLYKLREILNQLAEWGVSMHGMVYCAYGGELRLSLNGQPPHHAHDYLIDKGFTFEAESCDYIYRPR